MRYKAKQLMSILSRVERGSTSPEDAEDELCNLFGYNLQDKRIDCPECNGAHFTSKPYININTCQECSNKWRVKE
jgi:hypothetical protein